MKTQNRPVSLFVPVACAAFVTVAVVGFLFATGRWTGNWLWPILFGVGLLG